MVLLRLGSEDVIYVPWAEDQDLVNEASDYAFHSREEDRRPLVIAGGECSAARAAALERRGIRRNFHRVAASEQRRIWILAHGAAGTKEIGGNSINHLLSPIALAKQMEHEGFRPTMAKEIFAFSCYAGIPGGFAHCLFMVLRVWFPHLTIRTSGFAGITGTIYDDGAFDCIHIVQGMSKERIRHIENNPQAEDVQRLRVMLHVNNLAVFHANPLIGVP